MGMARITKAKEMNEQNAFMTSNSTCRTCSNTHNKSSYMSFSSLYFYIFLGMSHKGFNKAIKAPGKLTSCAKRFCQPVKTSFPLTEKNVNEIPL